MFVAYRKVTVSSTVQTFASIDTPDGFKNATHCQIQAETGPIRFRMDKGTPTTSSGMLLLTTEPPTSYLMEDIKRMKFIRNGTQDAVLHLHFFAGRDV